MELFFAWCFTTLVVLFIADFSDIGNLQFSITFVAFLLYLLYLGGYINIDDAMSNMSSNVTTMIQKCVELPLKLKDMFGLELDLYMKTMNGMKDVNGNDPSEIYVDDKALKTDMATASNIQMEYFLIDKLFRDLRIVDSNLYIEHVFSQKNV